MFEKKTSCKTVLSKFFDHAREWVIRFTWVGWAQSQRGVGKGGAQIGLDGRSHEGG